YYPSRPTYANDVSYTNCSQILITKTAITEHQREMLNGHYTIFGQCDDATVALVKQIARIGRDANDRPYRPVKINHITIVKAGGSSVSPAKKEATPAKAASPTPKQQWIAESYALSFRMGFSHEESAFPCEQQIPQD